jgi:hypothetical protein
MTVSRRARLATAGASAGDLEFVVGDSYALSGNASGAGGNDTLDGGPGFRDRVTGDNRSEKNGVASGNGGDDLVVDSSGDFDVLTSDNASFGPSPTVGEGDDDVLRNPRRGIIRAFQTPSKSYQRSETTSEDLGDQAVYMVKEY